MAILKDDRQFTIVDPLQHDGFETSQGFLESGEGGYIRTRDAELANEIQEREPWAIVTEHEPLTGGCGARGRAMMVVPELPWKGKLATEEKQENGNNS